jgi:hypothetical protein
MGMQTLQSHIQKATSSQKRKRIFLSVTLVILIITGSALLYWQLNKKRILRQEIESTVQKKSNGLYRLRYDKLQLDEVSGFLKITDIHLGYDSVILAAWMQQDDAPSSLFNVYIPEITVYGVKTPQVLLNKEIKGSKLTILEPSIEIIYTSAGKDSSRYTPTEEMYKQLLGELNQISLDTLYISGATIHTRNLKNDQHYIGLYNAAIQLTDVKVDSISNEDSSRMFFSKSVWLNCDSLFWNTDDGLYKIGGDTLMLNSVDNTIRLNRFYVKPFLSEDAFVHKVPTQIDRLDFTVRQIIVSQLDFPNLFNEEIRADNIHIASASFKLYRDLSMPRDNKNRIGTYPQQVIAKIPVPLEVKQLGLDDAYIEYAEKSDKTGKTGRVKFHQAKAVFKNISNRQTPTPGIMTADIQTRFLDKTPFYTKWNFYLNDENGRFDVAGTLHSIHAKEVNTLLEPMGPARMEDGKIQRLDFTLAGNDYNMNGQVKFMYENLKIAILEKEEGSKELSKKGVASFIANILAKNSNPSGNKEEPRTVTVTRKRDPNRSIFHLSVHTLLDGIKETMGINKK